MENQFLQYGEKINIQPGEIIYRPGDPPDEKPIYYLIAGLVKIEFNLAGGSAFPLYILPDSLFGLIEPILDCRRLTHAFCMEKSILYRWDLESFDLAAGVAWELALNTITGLTRMLRIFNAEFGERIGLVEDRI